MQEKIYGHVLTSKAKCSAKRCVLVASRARCWKASLQKLMKQRRITFCDRVVNGRDKLVVWNDVSFSLGNSEKRGVRRLWHDPEFLRFFSARF